MKIDTSNVSMASARTSYTYSKVEHESLTISSSKAATIELSKEAGDLAGQLKEAKEDMAKEAKEQEKLAAEERKQNQKKALQEMLKQNKEAAKANAAKYAEMQTEEDGEIQMLKRLLELLDKIRNGEKENSKSGDKCSSDGRSLSMDALMTGTTGLDGLKNLFNNAGMFGTANVGESATGVTSGNIVTLNTWTRIDCTSMFVSESECTAYQSSGNVTTADGREISFNLTVEMSRSFQATYDSYMEDTYTMVDPLVINIGNSSANVIDKRFRFDLDADGKEEEIAGLGEGSGFLALDKNGDGKINDGSELFGTKSGDGFKDLAAYDEDGNGWIDENDSVFSKLKIWTKDEEGKDVLLNLKQADVGAIYLDSASTQFHVKSMANNQTQGVIRKTGFFLKESTGQAGTIQHVDLAV